MVQSGSTSSGEQPHTQKISRLHRTSCNVGATVVRTPTCPKSHHPTYFYRSKVQNSLTLNRNESKSIDLLKKVEFWGIAQLGERLNGIQEEVSGLIF